MNPRKLRGLYFEDGLVDVEENDLVLFRSQPRDAFFWPNRAVSAIREDCRKCPGRRTPRYSHAEINYVIPQSITDLYADAVDTFSDVLAWLKTVVGAKAVAMMVSSLDRGLARLVQQQIPVCVHAARIQWQRAHTHIDIFFALSTDRGKNRLDIPPATYMRIGESLPTLITQHLMPQCVIVIERPASLPSAIKLAARWLQYAPAAENSECIRCFQPIMLFGPLDQLNEQKKLLAPMQLHVGAGRPRLGDYTVVPADRCINFRACYCERSIGWLRNSYYRWPAAQERLVRLIMALGGAGCGELPHLSPFLLLWIFQKLPGALVHRELACLRTIDGTLASMSHVRAARPTPIKKLAKYVLFRRAARTS
jgi:hypothetical protein